MRPFSLLLTAAIPLLFTACTSTELARVLQPVARELPLAQINHRTGDADHLEMAIWRDGTVLHQYDRNRYVVSHAMPATLKRLKRQIEELDFEVSHTPPPANAGPA